MKLEGETPLDEDHPAVEAIWKWIEAEYAAGQGDAISDEEMLTLVMTHLKLGVKTDLITYFVMEGQGAYHAMVHVSVGNALSWNSTTTDRRDVDGHTVRLWHGTTEHRAMKIVKEGFNGNFARTKNS